MLDPDRGIITFRAEGNNIRNSKFYSRVIHWPENIKKCSSLDAKSGVTIGRGYDMRHRSKELIIRDLRMAGVPIEQAHKISLAAKLHNCDASAFVSKNRNDIGEITEIQQLKLFNLVYMRYQSDAEIFYNKYKSNDSLQWRSLDVKIKDVFIDMKYQGVLHRNHILIFEKNNISDIIQLIQSTPKLNQYENARNRIGFLKGNV